MSEFDAPVRVLHVDDDPAMVEMVGVFLEQAGMVTVGVSSAADALAVLEDEPIDCLVSDYDMPGRTGLDLLEAVRDRCGELPFILFTGKGSEEIASGAISAGVDDYLQKKTTPDQYEVLSQRIRTHVEKHRAEQALRQAEGRYHRLVEQSLVGIYIVKEDVFVYANPGLASILGRSQESLVGMSPLEVVHPDDRELVAENLRRRAEGEIESIRYAFRCVRPDGTVITVEVHGGRIEYDGGPAVAGVLLAVDHRPAPDPAVEDALGALHEALDRAGEGDALADARAAADRLASLVAACE
ncbi:response regulator [Natronomonas sp. EA1]|uniref:response regulator n=1 Tax=Natronomonas sp. EA1 TaxID=3421655 RepID=UPI003EB98228